MWHHRLAIRAFTVAALVLSMAPAAQADWTGKGEAGALVSRGNADATSANAKLEIAREGTSWKNSLFYAVLYGENATFTTAQRMDARWQTNYSFSNGVSWFGAVRGEQDRFSGFDYQASLSTGVGYAFIDTADTKLNGTLGAGYRRLRPETLIKDPAGQVLERIKGDATGDAIATAGLGFDHRLTQTTSLLNRFLVESGSSNTTAQNDIAVQVSMTEAIALSVGYGIRYNSAPPPGSTKTDKITTVNLVYSID